MASVRAVERMAYRLMKWPLFFGIAVSILWPSRCHSQQPETNLADTPALPIPNSGHAYINLLSESVNPGDGTVSLSINLPMPSGRGINLPFSIQYSSSNSSRMMSHTTDAGADGYDSSLAWTLNYDFMQQGGWRYTLPTLTVSEGERYMGLVTQGTTNVPSYCYYYSGYTFQDAQGVSEGSTLGLIAGYSYPSEYNCVQGGSMNPTLYDQVGNYTLTLAPDSGPPNGPNSAPGIQARIADSDNNLFLFDYSYAHPNVTEASWVAFPTTIEDRNGNTIAVTDTAQSCNPVNCASGGVSYTDTLGRPLLATNGFGQTGNTITVAGYAQPYTLSWTPLPANLTPLPTSATYVGSLPAEQVGCPESGPTPIPNLNPGISAIKLPNGQQYSFLYNNMGYLRQINFPDGGYISYTYASFPQSSIQGFYEKRMGYSSECSYEVDAYNIQTRTVSYDGSTIALQQTYQYTTSWPSGNDGYAEWTTKTTTVKTTDNLSGLSYVTVYKYQPGALNLADSNLDTSDYTFLPFPPWEYEIDRYPGPSISSSPLDIETIAWGGESEKTCDLHTSAIGNVSGDINVWLAPGVLADNKEFSYGLLSTSTCQNLASLPAPTRETVNMYQSFPPSPLIYQPASINPLQTLIDRPCSTLVKGSGGARLSETDYLYDGGSAICGTAGSPTVLPVGGLPTGTHDETLFGTSQSTYRGNVTSEIFDCWVPTGGCNSGNSKKNLTYDETGQIISVTDPCGNVVCADMPGVTSHSTTFSYSDSPAGGNAKGNSNAYVTVVTDSLGHQVNLTYNYANGLLASQTDVNENPTYYYYNDPFLRLTEVDYPGGGKTGICYSNPGSSAFQPCYPGDQSASPPSTTTTVAASPDPSRVDVQLYDGMGHLTQNQVLSASPTPIYTIYKYDGMGNVLSQTNPFFSQSDSTYGTTIYTYDALGRKVTRQSPGTSIPRQWCYDNFPTAAQTNCFPLASSPGAAVEWVDISDENGNDWQDASDAFDRLVQVKEPGNLITGYGYNGLNNLTSVAQLGTTNDIPRSRNFSYDSLSRLIASSNPEMASVTQPPSLSCPGATGASWTNCYVYDANGNLASKTDNRTITTSYTYDAVNRILSKGYSANANGTPSSCYQYDSTSVSNGIGRLTSEWTLSPSNASCPAVTPFLTKRSFAFDQMGRIVNEWQYTPANQQGGQVYAPVYSYNLAGSLHTSSDGSTPSVTTPDTLLTFTNTYDGAANLLTVTSNWVDPTPPVVHPATLFSVPANTTNLPCANSSALPYTAFGGLQNAAYGSGLTLNRGYDVRLRMTCETDIGSNAAATGGTATVIITGSEQTRQ
jgi:YD repeat-containing protein